MPRVESHERGGDPLGLERCVMAQNVNTKAQVWNCTERTKSKGKADILAYWDYSDDDPKGSLILTGFALDASVTLDWFYKRPLAQQDQNIKNESIKNRDAFER